MNYLIACFLLGLAGAAAFTGFMGVSMLLLSAAILVAFVYDGEEPWP